MADSFKRLHAPAGATPAHYGTRMDELTTASAAPDILVLAAHPNWRESRVNRQLLSVAYRIG
ncbi:MAG TPA: hypothetical protein VKD22_04430, partial [Ramlibacter sp.]|nr:hypothetical protein [Ramlibacter sp.]